MENIQDFVKQFVNQTREPIFLTGKAGTGKTTLLNEIKKTTHKNTVVVAPTGIAALNAGGVTIHSFFQLPFASFIPEFQSNLLAQESIKFETKSSLKRHFNINKKRKDIFLNLELLIIDEVSMLRADLLDAIDWTLRTIRNINTPFANVQVLFIGDLMQLPPVVKPEEWSVLKNYYPHLFFFAAHALRQQQPVFLSLDKIYRQEDEEFITILNSLRNNQLSSSMLAQLNQHVLKENEEKNLEEYITLTTHNHKADKINENALNELNSKEFSFKAEVTGDFPSHIFPNEEQLKLKVGAQIMFIKNDLSFEKNYFNGKIGSIEKIEDDEIFVHFKEENKSIQIEKFEWENKRYSYNEKTKEIDEETIGNFVQYPIKLAWAITVHKSQGLTFEKAIIDISDSFAPGQAYVALSRLKSLKGLKLSSKLNQLGVSTSPDILAYTNQKFEKEQIKLFLEHKQKHYLLEELVQLFDFGSLINAFRIHASSYESLSKKMEKFKHAVWAIHKEKAMQNLNEPYKKFQNQLQRIILSTPFDSDLLFERVSAAQSYFFEILEKHYVSLLDKIEEITKKQNTKAYIEELVELEELFSKHLYHLFKVKNLVLSFTNSQEAISQADINREFMQFKAGKIVLVKKQFREQNALLSLIDEKDDESILPLKIIKNNKKEVIKRSSIEQSFDLYKEGKSFKEIAEIRILTEDTICNHFVQLIKKEHVNIQDILSDEKIKSLSKAFKKNENASLSEIKNKLEDHVTWNDLKLFRASLII